MYKLIIGIVSCLMIVGCVSQDKRIDNIANQNSLKTDQEVVALIKSKLANPKINQTEKKKFVKAVEKRMRQTNTLENKKTKLFALLVEKGADKNFSLDDMKRTVDRIKEIEYKKVDLKIDNLKGLKFLIQDKLDDESSKELTMQILQHDRELRGIEPWTLGQ